MLIHVAVEIEVYSPDEGPACGWDCPGLSEKHGERETWCSIYKEDVGYNDGPMRCPGCLAGEAKLKALIESGGKL